MTSPQKKAARTIHGSNADCPEVRSGEWTRCLGHGPLINAQSAENTGSNLRNSGDPRVAALRQGIVNAIGLLELPAQWAVGAALTELKARLRNDDEAAAATAREESV